MTAASVGRARALWFRCDLRLDDNLTLQAAATGAAALLPIYVFDPRKFNTPTLAGARKCSARRARFLLESVAALRKQLEARGSGLAVAVGQPKEIVAKWCTGMDGVWVQEGFCSEEQAEEACVAKSLQNCKLNKVWAGTLYMPDECGNPPGNTPLLFTNFKNKAEGRGRIRDPVPAPKQLPPLPAESPERPKDAFEFMPTLQDLGYGDEEAAAAAEDDPRGVMPFQGGEEAAMQRLQKWMWEDDKLREYFEIRNGMLGEGYSSKFSPWIALGCLSPRRVWKEAQRYEAERAKNKSTYWLVFELTWRDFYIYMARSQGTKIFLRGGVVGDKTPWRKDPAALRKWKEGRTGDQLVDANMRELAATGWMSNRGRQNVASYLIFDLGVDWRYGAAHFEEHLLDYDPAANWGNWVAAAGLTGQRINKFNTKKQLNDYDPQRKYVRHWLHGSGDSPKGSGEEEDDDEEEPRARAERADKGKGKGKGGGYSGKGGRGKGCRDAASRPGERAEARARRWRKAEQPEWQAQAA
mmetsp:Transcript_62943/g.182567  ORF Transcript_62943/g.182567 Transcript_62943/m.182567 type:complete len:524 (+) Transcript_62943:61-1632(+)